MNKPPLHKILLDHAESTNNVAATMSVAKAPHGTAVYTYRQTAGRGQRGNSWESEPLKNLTFSLVLRPAAIPVQGQFSLSMAVSLAIVEALDGIVPTPSLLKIKWPNDIYYGNKKLAGILIENSIAGQNIARSIVGIGLNVNQTAFLSDAPNPVSLAQICHTEHDCDALLEHIALAILSKIDALGTSLAVTVDGAPQQQLVHDYMRRLWRYDGATHLWRDTRNENGLIFEAKIIGIGSWGTLVLQLPDGTTAEFQFKEVAAAL